MPIALGHRAVGVTEQGADDWQAGAAQNGAAGEAVAKVMQPDAVGLTACAAYSSNGGSFKPIDYVVA